MPVRPGFRAPFHLTESQKDLVERPLEGTVFLDGPAGSGKTTAGVERLLYLMSQGVPGNNILLFVPQRTLAEPYRIALQHPDVLAGGTVTTLTIGGLAQRMDDLFWPLISGEAGFARPDLPPVFLTLETAQYFMAYVTRPLVEKEGFFSSIRVPRNRLYSQILDNLNKAAVTGIPYQEIGQRLKSAWTGESAQARVYDDAQECALRFRRYCLDHNLLDFSLQLEVFLKYLWPNPLVREYLLNTYHHLIADNIEEDIPVFHDLLAGWLPEVDTALLIYDSEAGYRSFLGADPANAFRLRSECSERVHFETSLVTTRSLWAFSEQISQAIQRRPAFRPSSLQTTNPGGNGKKNPDGNGSRGPGVDVPLNLDGAVHFGSHAYYPDMIDWVVSQIERLVNVEGVPPSEIVVIAPYLTDALRFALTYRLGQHSIPVRSHRPSRALRDEPAVQSMLTLAALAHPQWGIIPTHFDVAYALLEALDGFDLVRAKLLTHEVYHPTPERPQLAPFDQVQPKFQNRITYHYGQRYRDLYNWISAYQSGAPLEIDYFFSRLFGELLSQPGFGFHRDYTAGGAAANLVESARKFRWVAGESLANDGRPLGQEYLHMVQDGVVAAQYVRSWQPIREEAVLLAPAYTFLLANRPVCYQFWMDIGSSGWSERLYQPLTHPYVLSRSWEPETIWTYDREMEAAGETLERLVTGLIRRCRTSIYFGFSQLSEQGYEYQGDLLKALNRVRRVVESGRTR